MVDPPAAYLDASALLKLIVDEPGSAELRGWLTPDVRIVMSRVGAIELVRAVRRLRRDLENETSAVLSAVDLVELDAELAADAGVLVPVTLRTFDAIHIATAIRLRAAVPTFVAYDARLLAAARENGLRTASPGVDLL
ncbi:MAG TPA: type II toxin-antitoxin system VapC family toxin [Candidatus Limnocylindrales bacterium]|nr:type II toxin-antitoxin system VapC family toxin [Candidatus Limnocylindrales bacterium]